VPDERIKVSLDPPKEGLTPYAVSFSPELQDDIQKGRIPVPDLPSQLASLAQFFENNEELCSSLKSPAPSQAMTMRQFDLREYENGPIAMKCFVRWNPEITRWHIHCEKPNETIYEQHQIHPEEN